MSSLPKPIIVNLTDEQKMELVPLFDSLVAFDEPGMVLAQVFPDGMRVGVMPPEKARKLLKAIGQDLDNTRVTSRVLP